jgi:hypothetical protein
VKPATSRHSASFPLLASALCGPKDGKLEGRHPFRHGGSFAQEYWHPHPSSSPGRFVPFARNLAGIGDVSLISLPR